MRPLPIVLTFAALLVLPTAAALVIGVADAWVVDARGLRTEGLFPLETGRLYEVTVSGVYAYSQDGLADCRHYTFPNVATWNRGGRMLWWDDGTGGKEFPCGPFTDTHTYTVRVVGRGAVPQYWINDSNYADNQGALVFALRAI